MSHVVEIQTEVRDADVVQAGCRRLRWPPPEHKEVELFNSRQTGWAVQLPEWKYPVVCDTETGRTYFDNYEGRWGDQRHLDRFLQIYAVEKAKLEARKAGHTAAEQLQSDGSIKVTVTLATGYGSGGTGYGTRHGAGRGVA